MKTIEVAPENISEFKWAMNSTFWISLWSDNYDAYPHIGSLRKAVLDKIPTHQFAEGFSTKDITAEFLRTYFATKLSIDGKNIQASTRLDGLIPINQRRKMWNDLRKNYFLTIESLEYRSAKKIRNFLIGTMVTVLGSAILFFVLCGFAGLITLVLYGINFYYEVEVIFAYFEKTTHFLGKCMVFFGTLAIGILLSALALFELTSSFRVHFPFQTFGNLVESVAFNNFYRMHELTGKALSKAEVDQCIDYFLLKLEIIENKEDLNDENLIEIM
jgi:hypothetical protein